MSDHKFAILFDDCDVLMRYFCGEGAESTARQSFEQASISWSCVLFADIAQVDTLKTRIAELETRIEISQTRQQRLLDDGDGYRRRIAELEAELSAQTNVITRLCLAIDPDCKNGPESEKIAAYATQTRKLALDIATNPSVNLHYLNNKKREIRQHLDFQHEVNGGFE